VTWRAPSGVVDHTELLLSVHDQIRLVPPVPWRNWRAALTLALLCLGDGMVTAGG